MPHLSAQQAYLAMFQFLQEKYRLGGLDDLGWLLGSMSVLADGSPADPAFTHDWQQAVQAALSGKVEPLLNQKSREFLWLSALHIELWSKVLTGHSTRTQRAACPKSLAPCGATLRLSDMKRQSPSGTADHADEGSKMSRAQIESEIQRCLWGSENGGSSQGRKSFF